MDQSLFSGTKLGELSLKNRFIKAATYEGMYKDGVPLVALNQHHAQLAQGGVALTTVSYGAISEQGKTFKDQMKIEDRVLPQRP